MQPNLTMVLEQVGKDKGIDVKILLQTLEQAILTAAKKVFGLHRELEAQYNEDIGAVDLFQICYVVDEPEAPTKGREITKAQPIDAGLEAEIGDELLFQIFYRNEDAEKAREQETKYGDLLDLTDTIKQFGRIAAQTAKQVIIQRIREAERENVFNEYKDRKGELITGIVRRFERGNIIVEIGRKAEAILPVREQVPRESYRAGDRIVAYVVDIEKNARGPQIVLSRTHKGLLEKLFEQEVPEIYEKIVRIESSAREPGARAKIAVSSRDRDVDPVGACVGMKGSRVQAVVQELRGEKIDIVPYIGGSGALRVQRHRAGRGFARRHRRRDPHAWSSIVPDDKLSLAIGKKGQNVRLASQLTGWRIDIHSESKVRELEEQRQALDGRDGRLVRGAGRHAVQARLALGRRRRDRQDRGAGRRPGRRRRSRRGADQGSGGQAGGGRERQRSREAAERAAPQAAEAKKSDEQRLLSVRGIGENTLPSLVPGRLHQRARSSIRKRTSTAWRNRRAIGLKKARQLKHWVKVYLGELDASTPEPDEAEAGSRIRRCRRAPAVGCRQDRRAAESGAAWWWTAPDG